jgi:hypothetical protein
MGIRRSVGVVRLRTTATEFSLYLLSFKQYTSTERKNIPSTPKCKPCSLKYENTLVFMSDSYGP